MLLSVVVPVYNAEKYLDKCLDSLIGQSFRDMEIILVDDGSTDASGTICDEYTRRDERIRVIHKKNAGDCSAKRDGFLAAQGVYAGFLDSDDWLEPDFYELLTEKAVAHDADIVTGGFVVNDRDSRETDKFGEGVYEGERMKHLRQGVLFHERHGAGAILPSICCKVYRRTLLQPYFENLPDGIWMWEDICYTYPPFFDASRVVITHSCGYHYRVNPSSMTHQEDPGRWEKTLHTFSVAQDIYRRFPDDVYVSFCRFCATSFDFYLWRLCNHPAEGNVSVKESAGQLRKATDNETFRAITGVALQNGMDANKRVKRFLSKIMQKKYVSAVRYSRFRTGLSRLIRRG